MKPRTKASVENKISDRDELIPTRNSLLTRLKNWDDHDAWKDFFDTYWKLIYGVARKSGLTDVEAQEVVQDTVITVSKNIKKFRTGAEHGSFKAWLLKTTRWRIINQIRKRRRDEAGRGRQEDSEDRRTAALERIADPKAAELDAIWEKEWEGNLMGAALERLKTKVNSRHYQIFYLSVIKELPGREVADTLGVGVSMVYVTKLRLSRMVKKIYAQLKEGAI